MLVSRVAELQRRRLSWIIDQVLLVAVGVFFYFRVRGLTDAAPDIARIHAGQLVDLEETLHIQVESTVQQPLNSSEVLETLANWIYIWGHWPVLLASMAWLVWRHHPQFLQLRDAMLVSGGLGLLVFLSYPVAPPRLAGLGLEDTVTENSQAYRYLQPPAFVNQYAAMPSLHVGWDLLAAMAVVSAASSLLLRMLVCVMPALMAWAVIATANHYVLDVVAGVALVLIGHAVAVVLQRRRERRAEGKT